MSKRRQKITFLENMIVSHSLLSVRITVWRSCSSGHVNREDLLQLLPNSVSTEAKNLCVLRYEITIYCKAEKMPVGDYKTMI